MSRLNFSAKKRPSDGMIIADNGDIYVGDIEKNAVGVVNKDGYKMIVKE
ncbi:hypothetical protein [Vibrio lentus]